MAKHDHRTNPHLRRRPADLPDEWTCRSARCGKIFRPLRHNHIYCSLQCRAYENLRNHRAKHGRRKVGFVPGTILNCLACGKEFVQDRPNKWCCSRICSVRHATTKWREANPEFSANRLDAIRREVFVHYGNGEIACVCCGETEMRFLTIDHINGGGNAERKAIGVLGGVQFYFWLIKQEFPPGYQTLCYNCNMAKAHYGRCPHQERPAPLGLARDSDVEA